MTLQEAIDFASVHANTDQFGIFVKAIISMHDEVQNVFEGVVEGKSSAFRPDLPPLNSGTAAIAGGGVTPPATTARGSRFPQGPTPGFSTRGLPPQSGARGFLSLAQSSAGVGADIGGVTFPIDFSVRKDPGIPLLRFLGRGPSIQIAIERLSATGGTVLNGTTFEAAESGSLLRGVGPSLAWAGSASYTVTISVVSSQG